MYVLTDFLNWLCHLRLLTYIDFQFRFSSYSVLMKRTTISRIFLINFFFHLNLLIIINLERIWTTHSKKYKKINSFWHVLRKWTLFDKHTFQSQFHVIDFYSNISMNIYHFVLCFVFLSFNNLTNFFSSYQRSETSSWTSCTISCIFIRLFRKATSTSKIVVNVAAWNENSCVICNRCRRVIRDFEREAKTRCNF